MAKKIAIITIHGMGDTDTNYYKSFEKKLRRYVGKELWDEEVHLESVYFQDLLQGHQEDFWEEIDDQYSLRWDFIRKFMLFSFSDAASIEHSLRNDLELYLGVHQKIATALDNSFIELGDEPKPVIVVAQSLGCEQITNYLWDAGVNKRFFAPPETGTPEQQSFRRLNSCCKFVTTGCNIPIFRAGLSERKIFKRPNDDFYWDNYFDADDVLGYPIKILSDDFNVDWISDNKVSVGGFLAGWNPASHLKYWTDKDVLKPIADEITRIL